MAHVINMVGFISLDPSTIFIPLCMYFDKMITVIQVEVRGGFSCQAAAQRTIQLRDAAGKNTSDEQRRRSSEETASS